MVLLPATNFARWFGLPYQPNKHRPSQRKFYLQLYIFPLFSNEKYYPLYVAQRTNQTLEQNKTLSVCQNSRGFRRGNREYTAFEIVTFWSIFHVLSYSNKNQSHPTL